MTDQEVERFRSGESRTIGALGLVAALGVVLLGVTGAGGDYEPVAYAVCALFSVVVWVVLLRPAAAIEGVLLVLRNPLSTVRIPLAAVEHVAVGQWLAVLAGGRRFTYSGIGRSLRQIRRDEVRGDVTSTSPSRSSYGALVEERIRHRADEARAKLGIRPESAEQAALADEVRREPAWVEIVLLAGSVVAVVVTALLG